MGRSLYNLISFLAESSLYALSVFNQRIRLFLSSRNSSHHLPKLHESVVFHCASLGEYEESRPLIDYVKNKYPDLPLVVSFFSNSGYDQIDVKHPIDHKVYLPFDRFGNYTKFFNYLRPKILVISKYEFWPSLIETAQQEQVPVLHINTFMRKGQGIFKPYLKFLWKQFYSIDYLFTIDQKTKDDLLDLGFTQAKTVGDLRINRSIEIAKNALPYTIIKDQVSKPLIVFGSTWPTDEKIIVEFIRSHDEFQYILAPHDVSNHHISQIQTQLPNAQLLSDLTANNTWSCLLVDQIGDLKYLYQFATIAYVGGGLHHKVHNFLEATAFGIPVIIGPNHQNMPIAQSFIDEGYVSEVFDYQSTEKLLSTFRFTEQQKVELLKKLDIMSQGLTYIEQKFDELVDK